MRTTQIRVPQLAHISICASGSSTDGTVQSNIMKMAVMIQMHNSILTDELSVSCCHLFGERLRSFNRKNSYVTINSSHFKPLLYKNKNIILTAVSPEMINHTTCHDS
jgi:hypothetical protein